MAKRLVTHGSLQRTAELSTREVDVGALLKEPCTKGEVRMGSSLLECFVEIHLSLGLGDIQSQQPGENQLAAKDGYSEESRLCNGSCDIDISDTVKASVEWPDPRR